MKKFANFLNESELKPKVIAFGRFQGLHKGHEKVVDKVKSTALEHDAPHEIIASASHDGKTNPLTIDQKMKHLKRAFPDTNFTAASKEAPTLMHHAARVNKEGHNHLIMVAGQGRAEEYDKLLHAYNGKPDRTGKVPYHFKKITVVSSGDRNTLSKGVECASGTGQRNHVINNNFSAFKKNLPSAMKDHHAKELFKDLRHGMGVSVKESVERFYRKFVEENLVGGGADSDQRNNSIFQLRKDHEGLHKTKAKK